MRIIITFETTHKLLAAEKALKSAKESNFRFRPTPTPPGLTESVCGMALEVLIAGQKQDIINFLDSQKIAPKGVFEIER
jgi:hypothetical protein